MAFFGHCLMTYRSPNFSAEACRHNLHRRAGQCFTAKGAGTAPAVFELGFRYSASRCGMHLICHMLGGRVSPCRCSEYGTLDAEIDTTSALFAGLEKVERF